MKQHGELRTTVSPSKPSLQSLCFCEPCGFDRFYFHLLNVIFLVARVITIFIHLFTPSKREQQRMSHLRAAFLRLVSGSSRIPKTNALMWGLKRIIWITDLLLHSPNPALKLNMPHFVSRYPKKHVSKSAWRTTRF